MKLNDFRKDDRAVMSEINITPFVDVMLVLLIVFIVATPMIHNSSNIHLPSSKVHKVINQSETLKLEIDINGTYLLNQISIPVNALESELRRASNKNPQLSISIFGDKNVPYEYVAKAIAIMHRAGLTKVGFITIPTHP